MAAADCYDTGIATVDSSTFSENVSAMRGSGTVNDNGGGGILDLGNLYVVNSTLSGNVAAGGSGGGIRSLGSHSCCEMSRWPTITRTTARPVASTVCK